MFRKIRNSDVYKGRQTSAWLRRVYKWKTQYPLMIESYTSYNLSPQQTILAVGARYPEAYFTTDVGQHQMWSAQLINCKPKYSCNVHIHYNKKRISSLASIEKMTFLHVSNQDAGCSNI